MIKDHIILQSYLIYFKKTCYIVRNLKKKSKLSPPLLNPQSKHTLNISFRYKKHKNQTEPFIHSILMTAMVVRELKGAFLIDVRSLVDRSLLI